MQGDVRAISCSKITSHTLHLPWHLRLISGWPLPAEAQKEVPVIIFGHGFSQPVNVYMGTLEVLARELGAVIIAPYTSLAVAFPWKAVQGAGAGPLGAFTAPPPAKLQVRTLKGFGMGFRAAGRTHRAPARQAAGAHPDGFDKGSGSQGRWAHSPRPRPPISRCAPSWVLMWV